MEEIKQQIENQEKVYSNPNQEFNTPKATNRKPLRDCVCGYSCRIKKN